MDPSSIARALRSGAPRRAPTCHPARAASLVRRTRPTVRPAASFACTSRETRARSPRSSPRSDGEVRKVCPQRVVERHDQHVLTFSGQEGRTPREDRALPEPAGPRIRRKPVAVRFSASLRWSVEYTAAVALARAGSRSHRRSSSATASSLLRTVPESTRKHGREVASATSRGQRSAGSGAELPDIASS